MGQAAGLTSPAAALLEALCNIEAAGHVPALERLSELREREGDSLGVAHAHFDFGIRERRKALAGDAHRSARLVPETQVHLPQCGFVSGPGFVEESPSALSGGGRTADAGPADHSQGEGS